MFRRCVIIISALALSACALHAASPLAGVGSNPAVPQVLQNGATPRAWVKLPTPSSPLGGVFAGDGRYWFSEPLTGNVAAMAMRGAVTEYPISGGVSGPVILGPDGALWFASWTQPTAGTYGSQFIGRIDSGGTVTEFPIGFDGGGAAYAFGADGRLWIDDQASSISGPYYMLVMDTQGKIVATYGGAPVGTFGGAPVVANMVLGPDQRLWVADIQDEEVGAIDETGHWSSYSLRGSACGFITGITVGPDGNLWFSSFYTSSCNVIGKITTDGVATIYHPWTTTNNRPWNLTRVGSYLWAVKNAASVLYRFKTDGTVRSLTATNSFDTTSKPVGAPDGNMWINATGGSLIAVHVNHILVVNPTHWTLTAGTQKAMTVTETSYAGAWTVTSSNPSSVTVTANATRGSYTINGVASGSATIETSDSMGNIFDTPITVL